MIDDKKGYLGAFSLTDTDLMIPFFKAAIFCFLMVYSMMPLTITSQKKKTKKKRTIEERLSLVVRPTDEPSLLVVFCSLVLLLLDGSVGVLHLIYGGVLMCSCHFQTE